MVFAESRWEQSERAMMSLPHNAARGWSGLFVGNLREWFTQNNLKVKGGGGMVLRRVGDRVIADMVDDDDLRAVVCSGCWFLEVYRLSELLTSRGEWREQMRGVGWREVLGREMEG